LLGWGLDPHPNNPILNSQFSINLNYGCGGNLQNQNDCGCDVKVLINLVKLVAIGLVFWWLSVMPARAEFCRQVDGHRICIVDIKRSAKNYWQYQAMVSTDGIEQPIASYDCRERSITDRDGNMSSFRSRKDGQLVCSLYRPRG
jgi:hypothetical protein